MKQDCSLLRMYNLIIPYCTCWSRSSSVLIIMCLKYFSLVCVYIYTFFVYNYVDRRLFYISWASMFPRTARQVPPVPAWRRRCDWSGHSAWGQTLLMWCRWQHQMPDTAVLMRSILLYFFLLSFSQLVLSIYNYVHFLFYF